MNIPLASKLRFEPKDVYAIIGALIISTAAFYASQVNAAVTAEKVRNLEASQQKQEQFEALVIKELGEIKTALAVEGATRNGERK